MASRNKIVYGKWTFEGRKIKSGNLYIASSLLSTSLEANTFSAVVESADKTLSNFERNTPLAYYYNDTPRGVFYVQDIERIGPNLYKISATSVIGILSEGQHYGGIYTGQTAEEIIAEICTSVPYYIQQKYKNIKLYGWLPIASPRDNLAQVLLAIGATVSTDFEGYLRIEGLWNGVIGELGKNRLYQGPAVNYGAKVTEVAVTEHQYVEGGEEKQLWEGTAQNGDIITFDEPMYSLNVSGVEILESGANYAKVSAGTGTLAGRPYIHNTREIRKEVSTSGTPNVKTVKNATLISLVNSNAVAQRLADYYKYTSTIKGKAVYRGESPGYRLSTYDPYDREQVNACLQSASVTISSVLAADETLLVGYVPPQIEEEEILEYHELLTEDGEWTVPENTYSVRAILIGGGQGGAKGKSGTNGTGGGNGSPGQSGKSGDGGAGGEGGKIYDVELDVTPGQKFSVHIGTGGDKNGGLGGDTTFGNYSSASGTTNQYGYTDLVTGTVYATSGEKGMQPEPADSPNTGYTYNMFTSFKASAGVHGTIFSKREYVGKYFYGRSVTAGTLEVRTELQPGTTTYNAYNKLEYYPTDGIDGGTPASGENATQFGCGGNGGHGGQGGGGGAGYTDVAYTGQEITTENQLGATWKFYVDSVVYNRSNGGSGAPGSDGGSGFQGCIILYYGVAKKKGSGLLIERNERGFVDKYGRYFVV